jgi:L-ascorbate metabolism protein UlaG (beta-lactamase superfamily)
MQVQLIRNATMRFTYAGHTFLADPDLAPKHSRRSFTGTSPNPLVDLPVSAQEVIDNIEMVIVSHLHQDHFDSVAQTLLPKNLPVFCQPGNEAALASQGFEHVTPIENQVAWNGIAISRIDGEHGSGPVLSDMGKVSGFVFQHEGEPTVYWAGDTILCDVVEQAIIRYQPDIIITHSSGAVWGDNVLIVMDAAQTLNVCQFAPESRVMAIHLDSLDHGTVSRASLKATATAAGISPSQLLIPQDGETLTLEK